MMPPPNNNPPPPQDQESRTQNPKTNSERPAAPEQGIKCPRCESPNTKFCYYNNYSLTQPRHFCKTCRRYWTNGGALRNVPIGGGCRKNKRPKSSLSSSSSSSRSLSCDPKDFQLHGITIPPSLDFSLSGLSYPSPITTGVFNFNQLSSFANVTVPATNALSSFQLHPTAASNSMVGLVPPNTELWSLGQSQSSTLSDPLNMAMQSMNVHGNLTSSIETLSNMNQELHMNMQQQRLAMMFGGPSQNGDDSGVVSVSQPVVMNGFENNQKVQQQQPVLFHQNLEISNSENLPGGSSLRKGPTSGGDTVTSTEWFFGNPYSAVTTAATTSNHGNNVNVNDVNNNLGNGALAWGDLQHQPFTALP